MEIKETIDCINAFYKTNGYSRTTRCKFKKIGRELLEFFESTGRKYSEEESYEWLAAKKKENKDNDKIIYYYNHAVHLINDVSKTGVMVAGISFPLFKSIIQPASPAWQDVLSGYLDELTQESKAKSTIEFSRRACTKFIKFLETNRCLTPEELGVNLCHRYEVEVTGHTTTNGKRAYQYRIRLFIRYLARRGLVERTLSYAIKTHYRIPHKNVTILNDSQKYEIQSAQNTESPVTNRSFAMAMLALFLGLRSIDIINLKFADIDWLNSTVKVIQQKTKKGLLLPLTPVVGNAIADYVLTYRPVTSSPFVFVSHRFPFEKLQTRGTCYRASLKLITQRPEGQPSGLQIMRRTLASDLLKHHVNHDIVSGYLGHSSTESIDPYLSTDSERMIECSLPLEDIGFPEVFR